jgi:hypothetical protein
MPRRLLPLAALVSIMLGAFSLAWSPASSAPAQRAATATPRPSESPDLLLADIRKVFRSHRPPPPYETYTMVRSQKTDYGYPDYLGSYTLKYWYRSSDHGALTRKISELGDVGPLVFQRPIFNAATDPGPPTADVFEPAPAHTFPPTYVPTPEASLPPTIAVVSVRAEFDYRVTLVQREGDELHLTLVPRRDPDRNRLRQLWVDAKTLEIRKLVATDKLFVEGDSQHPDPYPVLFTIEFGRLEGIPIMTHIHGVVYGGYDGDGKTVDYDFKDTQFPLTLPAWYFNDRDYAAHQDDAPE